MPRRWSTFLRADALSILLLACPAGCGAAEPGGDGDSSIDEDDGALDAVASDVEVETSVDADGGDSHEARTDVGGRVDTAPSTDVGVSDVASPPDTGPSDSGAHVDGGTDTALAPDSGVGIDSSSTVDSSVGVETRTSFDTGATCVATYFGSCITTKTSDGSVVDCRDYALSSGYPGSATIASGCPYTTATETRTWQTSPCPHATSVGGCRADFAAGGWCYSQTDWYYPPSTASDAETACVSAARTWIAP